MKGIIYKATDRWTGKVYVGQTVTSLKHRRREHEEDARNEGDRSLFHVALIQRNFDFKWEVIDTVEGDADYVHHFLNVAEEYHILKCRAAEEDYGYNSTYGGYSAKRPKHVQEVIGTGASKAYWQYDLDGNFLRGWDSLREIASFYERPKLTGKELKPGSGQWHGFQWRRKVTDFPPGNIGAYKVGVKSSIRVAVYGTDGNFVKECESYDGAKREFGRAYKLREDFSEKVVLSYSMREDKLFYRVTDGHPATVSVEILPPPKPKGQGLRQPSVKRKVDAYTKDGVFLARYGGVVEAERATGVDHGTIRKMCCKQEPIQVFAQTRYIWRYGDGEVRPTIDVIPYVPSDPYVHKKEHRVLQYTQDGKYIATFDRIQEASDATGDSYGIIRKQCMGGKVKSAKFQWRYYTEGYSQNIGKIDLLIPSRIRVGRPRKSTHTPGQLSMF